jgi:magnesium-transporting ATPase (P-type)
LNPEGEIEIPQELPRDAARSLLGLMCRAAVLANSGSLSRRGGSWSHHGDAVDVALLVMAHKAGVIQAETINRYPEIASIAFESERLFCASLNSVNGKQETFVKGAVERLLPMCTRMATAGDPLNLDSRLIEDQAEDLASRGYRVIALAAGELTLKADEVFSEEHLKGLTLIGLIAMIDPLRGEAQDAIVRCKQAGIKVAMVTGDHPATALAIARELELADSADQIVTGPQLKQAEDSAGVDRLTREARVFARVEPRQKLDIVQSLQRSGHFVAVSGDGANDAPALRAAQVGVAMGKSGTDVARETADLVITDDNFASTSLPAWRKAALPTPMSAR